MTLDDEGPDKRPAENLTPTLHDADDFRDFFDEKVKQVRVSTENWRPPASTSTTTVLLTQLAPCTEGEVRRLIAPSLTKLCVLDPVPTFLVKEMIDVLLP